MIAARRIIARAELFPSMRREQVRDQRKQCHATIELDGSTYRCGRDREHVDGIHDAFVEHGDGGSVRW